MTDHILTRVIPSSGAPLPVIGCGTWENFDVKGNQREQAPLNKVFQTLFALGGTVIDSSPMYGRAEEVVGSLLNAGSWQKRAFVATKVWKQGKAAGIQQMHRSMELLQRDRIDLMQVHNLVDWQLHLPTLRDWKAAGRITYVGVTHYSAAAYRELETVMRAETLDFVQLNYSLDERTAEKSLLPLAADRGVAVLVNLPFGAGQLLRRLRDKQLPAWAIDFGCKTWPMLLLKFVLSQRAVTCVIPGTGDEAHMAENCTAGTGKFLTPRCCDELRQFWDENCR